MQYTKLIWRDGQPHSEIFDDIYYSSDEDEHIPGENEFRHVFFKHNGLPERWAKRDAFVIAELGFGSGLNCVLTIREWLKHCDESDDDKTLHYVAIEKYPLSADDITAIISRYPDLKDICDELIRDYPPAVETTHCRRLFDNRVVLYYKFMDVYEALCDSRLNVDAWYLDGFSPAKNSDMWSKELFSCIAANSRERATCSTYTAAGFVKRNLQDAGFTVTKVAGYGKKRDMLVAKLPDAESEITKKPFKFIDSPWFELHADKRSKSKQAVIIGAGIAGLSVAYALVQRGWKVTVIDRHDADGKKASTNPAPIIYPRLSVNNDVDTHFFVMAYCYALSVFKSLQTKSQRKFWLDDGLLHMIDAGRIKQIIDKFQFNDDLISIVDDVISCRKTGQVTVEYPTAGVVLPEILNEVLKLECGDNLTVVDADITEVRRDADGWKCLHDGLLVKHAETLVIASGSEINDSGLPVSFPVDMIRGQVVVLNANQASSAISKTINADVHITPAINGQHYLGATYSKNNEALAVDRAESRELMEALDKVYPDMFDGSDYSDAWVGFRSMAKDRVPIVGAVPDELFFRKEYADICHGNTTNEYTAARYLDGLYISAAHGSRGFTSSFLAAEIISAQIAGEPLPVDKKILDYLNPSRFIVNDLKRR